MARSAVTGSEYRAQQSICPVCSATDIAAFVEISQVPVHCNLLCPTREEAMQAPRGDIQLGFCRGCGHIFNLAFNSELMAYSQAYENSLHFSPRFHSYAEALAARLIDRYELRGKNVIEIGCGKGEFLRLLCELGGNRGIGFDPGYVSDPKAGRAPERIKFVQDFYSERYADHQADLICCRHVLEHIQSPRELLNSVRHAIGNRSQTAIFFEVPNALFTLRDMGIWDLIYEHCSYFCPGSLAHLFRTCGFEIRELAEAYDDQFLYVEAFPGQSLVGDTRQSGNGLREIVALVTAFADQYRRKVESWRRQLERIADAGQRAVVWGGGSKGVTFLNTLRTQSQIAYVVDINPRKQGMYVVGTGQKIVPPEFLRDYRPEVVIVMNSTYSHEIGQLTKRLGLATSFMYP